MTETTKNTSGAASAEALRDALTDKLIKQGIIRSRPVETAFRTVPRHLFTPEATVGKAYDAESVVATKKDEHGITISSVSAPVIQAMMLEQAGIEPGMRVAEIGSGGVNAAMAAELVGREGEVITGDIDPFVTDRARRFLDSTGYQRIQVVTADGEGGFPDHTPLDRLLVTVGAWDIPPSWMEQLAADGRLVVPLRMRGLTRSVAFDKEGDHLVSRSTEICGFVTMQGAGAHKERLLLLRGKEIGLRFDDDWGADADALNGALDTGRAEVWTGVTVGRDEPFGRLQMWLATALDGFCQLSVDTTLDTGLVSPQNRMACPAVVNGGSFAYLAIDRTEEIPGAPVFEFGVHGFGPDGETVAERFAEQIRAWDRDHRHGPDPVIYVYPVGAPEDALPQGRVITKRHVRVVISWPLKGQATVHQPMREK
ncbi:MULTISPECIES: methyltransferase, FxLD system [unclassified Streptomyces]|uniref:methyltransferase, FxLD system n=1 Tax=unclassified Streptomyces TaxID=2593676 RepID=UPI00381BA430